MLRRLELDVTRRLDGLVSGDSWALPHGPGTEPAGARAYGPGDDARRIDWSLTARALDRPGAHDRGRTASSRPGSSPTARPAWTSARPSGRSARWSSAAVAAFGFLSVCGAGNRLGVIATGGDAAPADPGPTRPRSACSPPCPRLYDTPEQRAAARPGADLHAALMRSRAGPAAPGPGDRRGLRLPRHPSWATPLRRAGPSPPDRRRAGHRSAGDAAARRRHARRWSTPRRGARCTCRPTRPTLRERYAGRRRAARRDASAADRREPAPNTSALHRPRLADRRRPLRRPPAPGPPRRSGRA